VNGKRLQLLTEAVLKVSRVAFLGESSRPSHYWRPATSLLQDARSRAYV